MLAESVSDGILRIHGPGGGFCDFDPEGPVTVEVTTAPRTGQHGVRIAIAGRVGNFSMHSLGEASKFAKDAVRAIRYF
jgi:hypothetical protein